MIEFLNSLEWPAVFAIVGSIVTIVTGLFGYLIASKKLNGKNQIPQTKILTPQEYEKVHTRINEALARVAENEGDLKELKSSLRNLQQQLHEHEHRDINDFKLIEAKIDRLMEIIIRILQDDKI